MVKKIFGFVLTCALLTPFLSAQAGFVEGMTGAGKAIGGVGKTVVGGVGGFVGGVAPVVGEVAGVVGTVGEAAKGIGDIVNTVDCIEDWAKGKPCTPGGGGGGEGYGQNATGLIFPEDRPPSIASATHKENSFRRVVVNIVNFGLFFVGLLTMVVLTYGGVLYLTAGGDDGQHEKAKKIILFSAVGIFVILASFSLANTLLTAAEPDATGDPARVGFERGK